MCQYKRRALSSRLLMPTRVNCQFRTSGSARPVAINKTNFKEEFRKVNENHILDLHRRIDRILYFFNVSESDRSLSIIESTSEVSDIHANTISSFKKELCSFTK